MELARAQRELVARQGGRPAPRALSPTVSRVRTVPADPERLQASHILRPGHADPAEHVFADLGTRVLERLDRRRWHMLGVASARAGDGKALVATNLAIAIATQTQADTWLVDLDLRNPHVHRCFGFAPQVGVEQVLHGDIALTDAAVSPEGYAFLRLLPAQTPVASPAPCLSADTASSLFSALNPPEARRCVICILPPILDNDEWRLAAPHLQAALLVIADGRTGRREVRRCCEALHGLPIIGTVLNSVRDGVPGGGAAERS